MPPCGVPLRVSPYRQSSMYPALSILDTRRSNRLSRTFSDNIVNRTLWSMLSKEAATDYPPPRFPCFGNSYPRASPV